MAAAEVTPAPEIMEAARERLQGWLARTFAYTAYRGKPLEGVPQLRTDLEILLSAAAEIERLRALVKEAVETLAGRPGEALDAEELDTISACVRNDQRGRILDLELWELLRSYRAVLALLDKLEGR